VAAMVGNSLITKFTRAVSALALFAIAMPIWAIKLGDTEVPKERFIVYILIGHSNMIGRNNACDKQVDARLWNYKIDDGTNAWVPAQGPLFYDGHGKKSHGHYIGCGPGMPFLKRMAELYPDYRFGVIEWAWSGGRAVDFMRGGDHYQNLMPHAKAIQEDVTFGGILAMLGRMEARETTKGFAEQIRTMVEQWRNDLGVANLPYLQQRERPYNYRAKKIRKEQDRVAEVLPYSAVLKTDGPENHVGHFNGEGMNRWGREAAAIIKERGWLPVENTAAAVD
jgi:hypothetical protein